ncbi:MAG TPA: cytochrome c oxidase subunit II [Gaiella sp.]|nr:cytochrome c oxidase subunit II [Gaiella sp.]
MRFGRHILAIACALVAVLADASAALAGNGGFAPVSPESPNADGISQSWWFVSAFVLAIFLLVEVLLVVFVVRYRRRGRPRDEDGAQIHGADRLEIAWTIAPVIVLFAIAAFVFAKLPGIQDVPAASGGDDNLVVEVTGSQFTWEYRYPNGVVAIDRLRAPEGRTVELEVTAPDWDVVHSWWIPALGGKIDAIPGTVNTTWFRAKRAGVFPGQCAELCGIYHARMLASVEVLPAAEFDDWLADRETQQAAGTSPLGQELWEGTCAKCHGLDGDGEYGPRIAGSELLADSAAIEDLLREGRGEMPPVGRHWDDTEMDALTDYLEQNLGG